MTLGEATTKARELGHRLSSFRMLECTHGHRWMKAKCVRCGAVCIVMINGESHQDASVRSVFDGPCSKSGLRQPAA